jgi:ABC-type lipoprotein export system ATPase subunit
MKKALFLDDVVKSYPMGRRAVSNVHLTISEGEFTAIVGAPGSGKTTLMRLACGLTIPSSGYVFALEKELSRMGEKERAEFRNEHIGVVLREAVLLEGLTAAENAALPLIAGGMGRMEACSHARYLLKGLGLEKRANSLAGGLAKFERCMVTLARAAIRQPDVFLLDEPVADLSGKEKEGLFETIRAIANSNRCTTVCFTADHKFAANFDRVFLLQEGSIEE